MVPFPEFKYLSESSILLEWGNKIDLSTNRLIHQVSAHLTANPFTGFLELVPSYASITIFFDLMVIQKINPSINAETFIRSIVEKLIDSLRMSDNPKSCRLIEIPVLYNGPDLQPLAEQKNLTIEQIIEIHTSKTYDVFMMGFLPGFAYLGLVDESIAAPRHSSPRTQVTAGSVGIAGQQTGVYPLESPGGWQLIGMTPIKMFDAARPDPVLLRPGDQVQFIQIDELGFQRIQNG